MKVMIDIPEEIWEKENFCDYFGAWSEKLQEVIKSGTVVYKSEEYKNYVSRQSVKELIRSGISTDTEVDQDYVCELIDELPPITPKHSFEGMTNGEVMEAVFPKADVDRYIEEYGYLIYIDDETYFTREWWNTPYKGGDAE